MMLIVRLCPKEDMDKLWDYVENEVGKETSGLVTPLYASQTAGMMEVSIIFKVNHPDNIAHFVTENIAYCDEVHHTKTVVLMKPVFFPVPKKKPENLKRHVIHINTHPKHYKKFYNLLVDHEYPSNIFPIFVSYSLGEEDIIVNLAADSYETVRDFVNNVIQPLGGLERTVIYPVVKSKRFAPLSKLVEHQKKFIAEKAKKISDENVDLEFDWTFDEYAKITGAFSREL